MPFGRANLQHWARAALLPVLIAGATACGVTKEAAFTRGRGSDPCIQSIPACASLYAKCILDAERYTRQRFPQASPFRFLVEAPAQARIAVSLFFAEQQSAGSDTQIYWNEPGCADAERWASEGEDLFARAEDTGFMTEAAQVQQSGEHLIEVFSDLQGEVLISVDVESP